MGLYQFDIQFLPFGAVAELPSDFEVVVSEDGLETVGWWLSNQPDKNYTEIITRNFPTAKTYDPDYLRWGNEESILVEAVVDVGRVEGIGARIDVRNATIESLEKLISIAEELECYIYVMETKRLIDGGAAKLLEALSRSKAWQWAP